jgi:hypothetical protein
VPEGLLGFFLDSAKRCAKDCWFSHSFHVLHPTSLSVHTDRVPPDRVSGSGVCTKRIVVDALHHMFGRLSSIVAKGRLNGQKAVVVRYKEICMSAGLVR